MIKNINEEITIKIEDENYNIQKNCPVYDILLNKLRTIFKKKNYFTFPNNINKLDFDIYTNVLSEGVEIIKNIKDIFSAIKLTILLKDKETFNELITSGIIKFLDENKKNSSIEIECFILKNIDDDYNYEYDSSVFDIVSKLCINNIVLKLSNNLNLTNLNLKFLMDLPIYKHRLSIIEIIKKNFYFIDFEKNNFDLNLFLKNIFQVYDTNDNLFLVLNKEKDYSINEFKYKISNGDILPSISFYFQKENSVNFCKIDDLNIEITQNQKSLSEKNFSIKILNPQILNKKPCCILCKTNINNKVYFNCFFPNQYNQIFINVDSSILLMTQKKNQQIKIYFEINYTFSIFLYYITTNFNLLYEKNFDFLPKNIINIILKNNKFPKESLFSLFKYCINQNSLILEEEILKIIQNIKIDKISIDSYFELLLNFGYYIKSYKKICEILKEILHQKFYVTYNNNIQNLKFEFLLNTEIGKNESENIFEKLIQISTQNHIKLEKNLIKKQRLSYMSYNDTSFSNFSYQNNFLTSNQNLTTIHNNNNISTNNTSVLVNSRNNNNLKKMFQSQITTNDFKNLKSNTTEQKKFIRSYNNCKSDSKNKNDKERPKSETSLKTQLDKIKEKLYIEKMNKRYTSYKKRNNIKFIKK
jgi:hypothetical protein